MTRLLVCLTFCLLFTFLYRQPSPSDLPEEAPDQPAPSAESLRPNWLYVLTALPSAGMPAQLPWAGLFLVEQKAPAASDPLPDADPLIFLQQCIERCRREIHGASLMMRKQERVGGTLHPVEIVEAHYQVKPLSVYLKWHKGARKAEAVLYVEGENNNQMLVLPAGLLRVVGVVEKSLDSPESKQSGRYTIDQFGLQKMMERTEANWNKAHARGTLHVDYLGVYRLAEAGNRYCYKLHRSQYDRPEEDGVTDATIYIDTESWLQIGSIVKGEGDRLIGEYYFRDVQLNPTFAPNQFQRSILK